MIAPIGPARHDAAIGALADASAALQGPAEPGFGAKLEGAIANVDATMQSSDAALRSLAAGNEVDLHGAMIAMQEADIAMRAMVSVRDKVVGAYEQLMNLSI